VAALVVGQRTLVKADRFVVASGRVVGVGEGAAWVGQHVGEVAVEQLLEVGDCAFEHWDRFAATEQPARALRLSGCERPAQFSEKPARAPRVIGWAGPSSCSRSPKRRS
jgi:hypothetical protein